MHKAQGGPSMVDQQRVHGITVVWVAQRACTVRWAGVWPAGSGTPERTSLIRLMEGDGAGQLVSFYRGWHERWDVLNRADDGT
jgi:hypothetical protein